MEHSLNHYKSETIALCERKGWANISLDQLWMFLTEEIGELAGAIRRNNNHFQDRKRISIEGEIMDVLSYLFQLAHQFDIDLDSNVNA